MSLDSLSNADLAEIDRDERADACGCDNCRPVCQHCGFWLEAEDDFYDTRECVGCSEEISANWAPMSQADAEALEAALEKVRWAYEWSMRIEADWRPGGIGKAVKP